VHVSELRGTMLLTVARGASTGSKNGWYDPQPSRLLHNAYDAFDDLAYAGMTGARQTQHRRCPNIHFLK
jgi:hypothetical protein